MSNNATTYVINERPLTDDTLTVAADGYAFKGGYVAVLTFHTFENAWSDTAHVRRFRTMAAAETFIARRYGKSLEDLIWT